MAFDDALLHTSAERGRPLLRFYGWDRPAVSIGYLQDIASAPGQGYAVVRRPTGGGVVFHDHDFTYSVAAPAGHWLLRAGRMESYEWINRAVAAGLRHCAVPAVLTEAEIAAGTDRRRMVCFRNPTRYDVTADGQKVAGSAQRRTRHGLLHQGSILLPQDAAPVDPTALAEALARGFRDILNLDLVPFTPGKQLVRLVAELAAGKYGTDEWNARR
jgi:lipoate-protein ligase A